MTQMLLFESVAENAVVPTVVPAVVSPTRPAPQPTTTEKVTIEKATSDRDREGGLHHMGDLARLVLLRYDLVAKRRADRIRREAGAVASSQ